MRIAAEQAWAPPEILAQVGHLGEGLPFWLFRLDFMHRAMVNANRYPGVRPLKKRPSDYLKQVLGVDRVLYAMDYPYQFVPEEVKVTDELPIGEEDRSKLYHLNAQRVFKL